MGLASCSLRRKTPPRQHEYISLTLVFRGDIGEFGVGVSWRSRSLVKPVGHIGSGVAPGGGALNFFSGRGVRPGFPKCGACELTFASEKGGL